MNVSKNFAYGLMVLAAVMWATSGTLTELSYRAGATPMDVIFFQTAMTAGILGIAVGLLDRKSLMIRKKDFWPFFAFSIITGAFFAIAWYYCIDMVGVTTAVILLYMYPSMVTIASVSFLGEKLDRAKILALPLTFAGGVMVAGLRDIEGGLQFDMLGILLGLYAAVAAAIYYIWGKKFLEKNSANTVVFYMMMLSVPVLFILGNPVEIVQTNLGIEAWGYILAMAVIPGTIGFLLSMIALNIIEASKASIIASIEPAVAVAFACAILAEDINGYQMIGVALVTIGVVLLRLKEEDASKEKPKLPPTK
ncbi:MAG TPA: DMT family transporter [Thermoplasmata archaeon]